MRHLALIVPVFLAAACGGPSASRKPDPAPAAAAGEPARAQPADNKPTTATQPAAPEATPENAITRAVLMKFHKRGPQRFIARLRVKATFNRGRFFGWRMLSYRGPGPIKPGDVIIDVNGMPIERPDQFMKVWEKLPTIKELTVKLLRDGKPNTLRYPVVD